MEKVNLFDYADDDRRMSDNMDDVDELLDAIFHRGDSNSALQVFGGFLEARLANMGWSPDDLAATLQIEPHTIHGILGGMLPNEALTDALVERIAVALDYDVNTFMVMLRRAPQVPFTLGEADETQEAEAIKLDDEALHARYQEEMDGLLHEVNEILLQQLENYYSAEIRANVRTHKRQESIVKQIEMIITKHRADVRLVRDLIDELKAVDYKGEDVGQGLQTLSNIKRIIEHIKETI